MLRRIRLLWIVRVGVIWLCTTLGMSSAALHSGAALRDYVTPHFGGALIFAAAFVLALLLGLAVESPKAAVILSIAMCLAAAAVYGGVIYAPVWLDIAISTIAFQNYVSQQVLLLFLWCVIPAIAGALVGNFAGAGLRPQQRAADGERGAWWVTRRSGETETPESRHTM
ncbi:MAG: hypothetical protein DCC58_14980 [Chloroflexi bacterium]|nr:MAG: hypothetical protein DCC58_14980 [Chloroflexota bacterium]